MYEREESRETQNGICMTYIRGCWICPIVYSVGAVLSNFLSDSWRPRLHQNRPIPTTRPLILHLTADLVVIDIAAVTRTKTLLRSERRRPALTPKNVVDTTVTLPLILIPHQLTPIILGSSLII